MRPRTLTFSMAAADADGIAAAQAVGGAGDLTLNGALASGGVATLDVPRHVSVVSADVGDTTQTATVTGTDRYGNAISEVLTLNGTTTVKGSKNFKTITQVAMSAATVGNVSAGSADEADTAWFPWNWRADELHISVALSASASMTYGVEHSFDDINANGFLEDDAVNVHADATMSGESATSEARKEGGVRASRIRFTGYTSGMATITYTQPGA